MPREHFGQRRHCIGFTLVALAAAALSGCALPYYTQAVGGEIGIMRAERPIARVLADPATPPAVAHRLRYVLKVRRFARTHLGLALHGNYRDYADLHRPYVVWNVFAAPRLSLTLKRWCFPFAGCVAYRGYFSKTAAEHYARTLAHKGYDVFVGGVPAFATLGYLDDPVLNTFIGYSRTTIAHIIFHELAHDLIYVPNATTFDESFADTVAAVGVHRYLEVEGTPAERARYLRRRARHKAVIALMTACRRRLAGVYANRALDPRQKRAGRRAAYRALDAGFRALVHRWHGSHGYGAFFRARFNNARLGAYMSYENLVPAFRRLLALEDGDLPAFFAVVRWYGRLPAPFRDRELRSRAGLVSRGATPEPVNARAAFGRGLPEVLWARSARACRAASTTGRIIKRKPLRYFPFMVRNKCLAWPSSATVTKAYPRASRSPARPINTISPHPSKRTARSASVTVRDRFPI
nr:aminopeptidase [Acidiferrobacter sp.]